MTDSPFLFVHGRPGPHPFHGSLGDAVGARKEFVDPVLRWHDRPSSRVRRMASWALSALRFSRTPGVEVLISEGIHFAPSLAGRISGGGGLVTVALQDDETLHFLAVGRYPPRTERALLKALASYDHLVCVGEFQTELARRLLADRPDGPMIHSIPSGLDAERWESLARVQAPLRGAHLLFIGNGPGEWRAWYKGLDILLDAYRRVRVGDPEAGVPPEPGVTLTVVGDWEERVRAAAEGKMAEAMDPGSGPVPVRWLGLVDDLAPALADAALYVHPARGEAFGISVLEAMRAGVPAVVSELTGAKEVVTRIDGALVVPADPEAVAAAARRYLALPEEERRALGRRCREVAGEYRWEAAQDRFREILEAILAEARGARP